MAPAKSARNADDHKPDGGGPKDKSGGHQTSTKMRRVASQTSASHAAKVPNASASASAPAPGISESTAPALNWPSFDRDTLHAYRREHQLNTPTSFSSTYHQWVLSQPGSIGIYSPTMVCKRQARRQNKEHLAMAVRKHFNGMGIQENDVIVDFLYKIHCDKASKANGPNKLPEAK
ncbi:Uncharacterized protein TCAP_01310 [Tolypocladium capitatum]|uniref:Histone deacetylase complex subunit SAP30 Sin3 binding domain-containing protein n=1 Tax=Tolypocladium capitatum TaxID=45235 RepID=A0A2K3QML5_9HYPO|nr:Uncharacterized protein TCAP_01310 [Tolypocladium capitatum]